MINPNIIALLYPDALLPGDCFIVSPFQRASYIVLPFDDTADTITFHDDGPRVTLSVDRVSSLPPMATRLKVTRHVALTHCSVCHNRFYTLRTSPDGRKFADRCLHCSGDSQYDYTCIPGANPYQDPFRYGGMLRDRASDFYPPTLSRLSSGLLHSRTMID
jgi:hypothetical protein